jgi:hypothetical protein
MEENENKNGYQNPFSTKVKKLGSFRALGNFLIGLCYISVGLLMALYSILKILGMVILHILYMLVFLFPIIFLACGVIYCTSLFMYYSLYIAIFAAIAILISVFISTFLFVRYKIQDRMWKFWDQIYDIFDNVFDYSSEQNKY